MSFVPKEQIFGMKRNGAGQRLLNNKSTQTESPDLLSAGSKSSAPAQKATKNSSKRDEIKQQRGTNKGESIAPHLGADVNNDRGYIVPLPRGNFSIDPASIATIRIAGTSTVAPPSSDGKSDSSNYSLSTKLDANQLFEKYKQALQGSNPDTFTNTFVYRDGTHFARENGQPKIYLIDANYSLTQGGYPNRVGARVNTKQEGSITADHIINPIHDAATNQYYALITNPHLTTPSQASHNYESSYNSSVQSALGALTAKELESKEVVKGEGNTIKKIFAGSQKAEVAYKFDHPSGDDSRIVRFAGHVALGKDKILGYANEKRDDHEKSMYVRKTDGDAILKSWGEIASASADFNQNENGIEILYTPFTPGNEWRSFGGAEKSARFAFGKNDPITLHYDHQLTFGMAKFDKIPDEITLLFNPRGGE
jgi:hypothetical protein